MRRRDFLRWFRSAPVAVPMVAASAVAAGSEASNGALYLNGQKVMELRDGDLVVGRDLDAPPTPKNNGWESEPKLTFSRATYWR